METLTIVPVTSSYCDNGKKLCTYFRTSLLEQIQNHFRGPNDQRVLLLGHSDVVNSKAVQCKKLPGVSSVKFCQEVWAQTGTDFAGFACSLYGPQLPPRFYPYIYEVMTGLPAQDLIVVVVYGKGEFVIHHFDDAFVDWYREKQKR